MRPFIPFRDPGLDYAIAVLEASINLCAGILLLILSPIIIIISRTNRITHE